MVPFHCEWNIFSILIVVLISLAAASIAASDHALTFDGCPDDITLQVNQKDNESFPVLWNEPILYVKNDSAEVDVVSDVPPDNKFAFGCKRVTYIAVDEKGNSATCSFLVCVGRFSLVSIETSDHALTFDGCPDDITLQVNQKDDESVPVLWNDPILNANNDSAEVDVVSDVPPDNKFEFGCKRVTYIAVDKKGNSATCSFLVCVGRFSLTPGVIIAIIGVAVVAVVAFCCYLVFKCK